LFSPVLVAVLARGLRASRSCRPRALFHSWKGNHQIVYNWYAPDGSLFFNTTHARTDLGSAVLYA
jgi:hypothetical protein